MLQFVFQLQTSSRRESTNSDPISMWLAGFLIIDANAEDGADVAWEETSPLPSAGIPQSYVSEYFIAHPGKLRIQLNRVGENC